jgi:MinD superfamily P-loop ATPase
MKIAVASGKGGTGKTTISTNLASLISENSKVVLTDLDVEEPNSGIFIKGELIYDEVKYKLIPNWHKDTCTHCGKCQQVCNFNAVIQLGPEIIVFPELCHSCFACSELCSTDSLPMGQKEIGTTKHYANQSLSFIESQLTIGEEQAVPLISQTIKYVDKKFDDSYIKIFDAPPGTSCPVIESTKHVDFIVLVTEPTPFGLHDLKLAVDTMKELKKNFGVVINRYGIGNDDVIAYCEENEIEILAKIPNSREVAELYSDGQIVYDKIPHVKLEFQKLMFNILKKVEG